MGPRTSDCSRSGGCFSPATTARRSPPSRCASGSPGPARHDRPTGADRPPPAERDDLAGVVERLLATLRPGLETRRAPRTDLEGLHPGKTVAWTPAGDSAPLAWAGVLHPERRDALDLASNVLLAEIDLDRLRRTRTDGIRYRTVPRLPSASRDLSLILAPGVSYGEVTRALESVDPPVPATFEAVDRYVGPPLAEGEVSVTVRVILQPHDRTLTDAESEAYRRALVAALESTGKIRLRS